MSDQLTLEGVSTQQDTRVCTRCKGEKRVFRASFTYTDSLTGETTTYPDKWDRCSGCKGKGFFPAPDYDAILQLMTTGKGDKVRIRATMTSTKAFRSDDTNLHRATYCHRMACFHGRGKPGDQCLPMNAVYALGTDPWSKELDAFADTVAKRFFGTDMRAAMRIRDLIG